MARVIPPTKGVVTVTSFAETPKDASPDALNVLMTYDKIEGRFRAGNRPGCIKRYGNTINSNNPVQRMVVSSSLISEAAGTQDEVVWKKPIDVVTSKVLSVLHDEDDNSYIGLQETSGATLTKTVYKFDRNGTTVWSSLTAAQSGEYAVLAFDANGEVLAGNNGNGTVFQLDSSTGTVLSSYSAGHSIVRGLAVDSSGNVFFVLSDNNNNTDFNVYKLDSSLGLVTRFNTETQVSGLDSCWDVVVDSSDNVYVSAYDTGIPRIFKFDNDLTLLTSATPSNHASQMAIDSSNGYLYVDRTGTLEQRLLTDLSINNSAVVPGVSFVNDLYVTSETEIYVAANDSGGAALRRYDKETLAVQWAYAYVEGVNTADALAVTAASRDKIWAGMQDVSASDYKVFLLSEFNVGVATVQNDISVVAGGSIYKLENDTLTASTGSGSLAAGEYSIMGAEQDGVVYYVDGGSYITHTMSTNVRAAWTASAGSMPISGSATARLIAFYRRRCMLSGIVGADHLVYLSKVGDPTDWDDAPALVDLTSLSAVTLGATGSQEGGDYVVTALIPYKDDLCVIGFNHGISLLRGDPGYDMGGQVDRLPEASGILFGRPYAYGPGGRLFYASPYGIHMMRFSGDSMELPVLLTEFSTHQYFSELDLATVRINMEWDRRLNGLWVFISRIASGPSDFYFYHLPTNSFWPQRFAYEIGPVCTTVYDGDDPEDRVVLLAGRDGYIRMLDYDSSGDDGTAIASHLVYAPWIADDVNDLSLTELTAILDRRTDSLTYEVYNGNTAQEAVRSAIVGTSPWFSGTWTGGGRQRPVHSRARGNCLALKVKNTTLNERWAIEAVDANLEVVGPTRL